MGKEYEASQIRENKLAAGKVILFLPLAIAAYILNSLGIFYVEQSSITGTILVVIIGVVLIQIIGRVEDIAKNKYTKYVIMMLCFIITLVTLLLLNYHAILILCFPMLVALNYHSKKVAIMAFVMVCLCALLWPVLSVLCKTWEVSFFVFLIDVIAPEIVRDSPLTNYVAVTNLGMWDVVKFVSLPQLGFAVVFGVIIVISNRVSRRSYNNQIVELEDSRDQILAGISDIVESRDSNTGGHIKRSCMVVKLLVEEMYKDKEHNNIDSDFVKNVIKSAPMHDLGKIAVPDSILQKPAKLTEEEFEYIMLHPQKSYDIIESVLKGMKDEELLKIAGNIALYHHERYDGSGYPMGLKGEDIPLEARLMTIADVYDALVSRRCYKKPIPHEDAFEVIKNSMGTQFDPNLWKYFEKVYPKIVSFYS